MSTTKRVAGNEVSTVGTLSQTELLDVLAGVPDPLVVLDSACLLLWANAAAEAMFGLSAVAFHSKGLDLVHPDDLELALSSIVRMKEDSTPRPIEVRLRSADGWRLAELMGDPLTRSMDGTYILSIRDLTKRRGLEVATNDDAKLRSLMQNAAALTMLVSATGVVDAASGALARLLSQDPVKVVGRPLACLVEPSDQATLANGMEIASGRPQGLGDATTVELGLRRLSDGASVPFELTIVNLLDDPTVGGFVVTGHDLTGRKAVEVELLSTLSLLNATLNSTGDGVLVVDNEGAITTVNRKFAELWHIPGELLAKRDDAAALAHVLDQLVNPQGFQAKVAELYANPGAASHDVLHFLDGRVFDRYSEPQRVSGEIVGRVWSFRDSTERSRLEAQLAHQALHDPLTGLANQTLFRDRMEHALERLERVESHLAVLFLDVDNFKIVNDTLGHSAGDQLLTGVADRLAGCVRHPDTVARMGGDEFAILIDDAVSGEAVMAVAKRLLRAFEQPFPVDTAQISATISIGIACARQGMTNDQLLRNADLAMYAAKRTGKAQFRSFEGELNDACQHCHPVELSDQRSDPDARVTQ